MSFLDRLRQTFSRQRSDESSEENVPIIKKKDNLTDGYQLIPNYVDAPPESQELVSVLVSAIAAGNAEKTEWKIKRIQSVNPELKTIAIIASSIAAIDYPDSHFVVRRVYKK